MSDALAELERRGVLLLTDPKLLSVAGLVAGEPVRGSWWAHPASHQIARESGRLAAHPDVLIAKLAGGKVSFVHRKLWPAMLALGLAREPWQMRALPAPASQLLARIDREGAVEVSGAAGKELELRLLVQGHEVHTQRGSHARRLESWERWRSRTGIEPVPIQEAKRAIEAVMPPELLPWKRRPRR